MTTTSKITKIHKVTPYDKSGRETVYYHDVEFENGDRGSIGKAKENAFEIGHEIKYDLETTHFGKKIKEVNENPFIQGKGVAKPFNIDGVLIQQAVKLVELAMGDGNANLETLLKDVERTFIHFKSLTNK